MRLLSQIKINSYFIVPELGNQIWQKQKEGTAITVSGPPVIAKFYTPVVPYNGELPGDLLTCVDMFFKYCYAKQLSGNTIRAYGNAVKSFIIFLEEKNITNILNVTSNIFDEYIMELLQSKSARTAKHRQTIITVFFNFLKKKKIIPTNPAETKEFEIKLSKDLPRSLPRDIIQRFFKCAYENLHSAEGDNYRIILQKVCLVELLFYTGARISEAINLKRENVREDGIFIFGKGAKERFLPINDRNLIRLMETVDLINSSNRIFFFINRFKKKFEPGSIRKWIVEICEEAQIPYFVPHQCRHTFANSLMEQNIPIKIIQDALGHSSPATTNRYSMARPEQVRDALKKAKIKISPFAGQIMQPDPEQQ